MSVISTQGACFWRAAWTPRGNDSGSPIYYYSLAQLLELEKKFSFNEHEKTLIFEQRISILGRLMQWGVENEAMGLVGSISDSWTPEQRQQFIEDLMDDEPLIQEGFGKKRSYDEMRDDDSGTSTEVRDDKTLFYCNRLETSSSSEVCNNWVRLHD